MDVVEARSELGMLFDLAGRVRNLSLPANQGNSLIPLFEAVSNAIHAVEARWEANATTLGEVTITIHRRDVSDDSHVTGFTIKDNGVGITAANWSSFRTSDSPFKLSRGGKGVGRLSWLKAFKDCQVVSRFREGPEFFERKFCFSLKEINPIQGHALAQVDSPLMLGTEVHLEPFDTPFEAHCPKRTVTIASKIVGHFLPYFVLGKHPKLVLEDADEALDLGRFYFENQRRSTIDVLNLGVDLLSETKEFHVYHVLIRKNLKFLDSGYNWIFYAGNERVAKEENVDNQLGLRTIGDDGEYVYVGLVAGPYLDAHVNQERTSFTFGSDTAAEIHRAAVDSAKTFLREYIARIREYQTQTAMLVIRNNPQFLPFRDDIAEFVTSHLSLNTQGEENIYVELSRQKLRTRRKLDGQLRSLKEGNGEVVEAEVKQVTQALNDEKKSALAEYVVRRKSILDLLDSSLAFTNPEERRHYREDVVHGLIIPLGGSSDDLDYDQHNLWILDDRLAFYTFFKSDKQIRTYVDGSDSQREPDLAVVFEPSLAFRRQGEDEPIVIVEFKAPGRNNFDGNTNPVTQALDYVDMFRTGKHVKDKDGRVIKPISASTRFICFVVADFTDSLLRVVKSSPANNLMADGQGYFGFSPLHNATVEVVPYDKVLHDARVRNEAFFKQLGLV